MTVDPVAVTGEGVPIVLEAFGPRSVELLRQLSMELTAHLWSGIDQ
jgi:hypothetical protein